MVATTRGLLKPVRDKPDEELPSIPPEKMERRQSPAEQLKHCEEQIKLTRQYPGRSHAYPDRTPPDRC